MSKELDKERLEWLESTFATYRGQLMKYSLKMTGDLELSREAVQETFLRLCKQDRAKVAGREVQWLFTVCRNLIYDVKRKEKNVMSGIDQQLPDVSARPAADLVDLKQSASAVVTLMGRLPERQQELLRLKFQNELSYKEIAKVTGMSPSNVGFQIHKAVAKLKEEFQKIGEPVAAKGGAQ